MLPCRSIMPGGPRPLRTQPAERTGTVLDSANAARIPRFLACHPFQSPDLKADSLLTVRLPFHGASHGMTNHGVEDWAGSGLSGIGARCFWRGRSLRPISFNRDIRPMILKNCFHCHGPDPSEPQGQAAFRPRRRLLAAREKSGPTSSVQAGESELWKRLVAKDPRRRDARHPRSTRS